MRAIVYERYGPPEKVLRLAEVKKPIPADDEVRIRIRAASVTAADTMMRRGDSLIGRIFLGLRTPRKKILGTELAGEIESAGKNVKRFRKGDRVFGFTGFGLGAYAEYACMPEYGSLAALPANQTYAEAVACVDGGTTAIFFLRDKAKIRSGQKILVVGASGSIGTFAVQIAGHFGADVTGVCSGANADLVKSLGAGRVVDYTTEDFTRNGEVYDVIFDTVGKSSFTRCRDSLAGSGLYLAAAGGWTNYVQMVRTSLAGGRRVICGMSIEKADALDFLRGLIEAGTIKPVIDRMYPLERMAEAHRYVETGHKRGNVVITVGHPAQTV
jgi:NADPH:quinone reductase-like Zn-dependent oxidoreductase